LGRQRSEGPKYEARPGKRVNVNRQAGHGGAFPSYKRSIGWRTVVQDLGKKCTTLSKKITKAKKTEGEKKKTENMIQVVDCLPSKYEAPVLPKMKKNKKTTLPPPYSLKNFQIK
jgi:hypothetical protein